MIRPGVIPGILLIIFGLLIGLERINVITYIFEQFWALVIIIPCATSLKKNGLTRLNFIGIIIGLFIFTMTYFENLIALLGPITLLTSGIALLLIPNEK